MYDMKEIRKVVNRLYEFQGEDFTDQRVQFKFVRAVRSTIMELIREHNFYVVPDDFLGHGIVFSGVTFDGVSEYPMMCYEKI